MTDAIKKLVLIYYLFIILLMLSDFIGGLAGAYAKDSVYILGAAALVALGIYFARGLRREREEERGLVEESPGVLKMSASAVKDFLPLIAPTVAIVFLLAFLTSLILGALGATGTAVEDKHVLLMLLDNAFIPAVIEEMVFRFLPMMLLLPYSGRVCVLVSSLCFALVHCNLFQIPYAFAAGVIFICIDVMCESILPSLILHFLNNAASVIWIKYCTDDRSVLVFVSVLLALTLISLVFIIVRRRHYMERLKRVFIPGRKYANNVYLVAFVATTAIMAVVSLFM